MMKDGAITVRQEDATILNDVYEYIGRFVEFPDEHTRVAWTLWVAHTYLIDEFYYTPRLHITSASKRCGKTRLLNITNFLISNPVPPLINPSPASLFRMIDQGQGRAKISIDQMDELMSKKETSDITTIICSGFDRSGFKVPRVNEDGAVEFFDVFAAYVLAGIDKNNTPDSVQDRSIQIRLKRRSGKGKVEPWRPKKQAAVCLELAERLQRWADDICDKAKEMDDPTFPTGIEDRQADKWESIFIVADVADVTEVTGITGGADREHKWGALVRKAALYLLKEEQDADVTDPGELIVTHLDYIFLNDMSSKKKWATADLLEELNNKMPASPWSTYEWGSRPLSARGLGRLLARHGIKPRMLRFDKNHEARGYYTAWFDDARKRYPYVPSEANETPETSATPVTANPAKTAANTESPFQPF
jgi:hypothetical protein